MDSHLLAALMQTDTKPMSDEEALQQEPERPLSPYGRLRAVYSTEIPAQLPRRTITLRATGDMERYVWSFNDKTFAQEGVIPIKKGEVIRLVLINDTMMHHPLHLHGSFFRVLMGNGEYSPLKHTIDLPPMSKRVVEFEAKDKGDWLFHCHLLYHMHAGMTRIFSYQDDSWTPPPSDPEGGVPDARKHAATKKHSSGGSGGGVVGNHSGLTHVPQSGGHEHDPLYFLGSALVMNNYSEGVVALRNSKNDWFFGWDGSYKEWKNAELEAGWRRYLDPNRGYTLGFRYSNETKSKVQGFAGFEYRLPYLVWSSLQVDTRGSVRVGLEKELAITSRLSAFAAVEYDTRDSWEWRAGGRYILSKQASLILQHHSDYGIGFGFGITY